MRTIKDDDGDFWEERPDGRFECVTTNGAGIHSMSEIRRLFGIEKTLEDPV